MKYTKVGWLILLLLMCFPATLSAQVTYKTLTAASALCINTACVRVPLQPNTGTVTVQLQTFTGTVQFEGSANSGDTVAAISSTAGVTSATTAGLYQFSVAGLTHFQVRASSYSTAIPLALSVTPATSIMQSINQGSAGLSPWLFSPTASATNGADEYGFITTASTNATLFKAGASTVYMIYVNNPTATIAYVRPYDLAGVPDCSSATGAKTPIAVQPYETNGFALTVGLKYTLGMGVCVTGGGSLTDNTNAPVGVEIKLAVK